MNREFLKMQKLAGLITENRYHQLNEQMSFEEFNTKSFNNKIKYLADTQINLFSDITDDKFIELITTQYKPLAQLIAGNSGIINKDIVIKNKNKFNSQEQKAIEINYR